MSGANYVLLQKEAFYDANENDVTVISRIACLHIMQRCFSFG